MADERGTARRARDLAGRAKATPSRVEWLHANQESVNEALRTTIERLDAIAARLDRLEARLDDGAAPADDRLDLLDAAVAGHAQVLQRVIATPARDAELARLRTELGPAPDLRPGLSVFTICWNHGRLLGTAIASGLDLLDRLDPQHRGEVLVLDDGSSDDSFVVADEWSGRDGRVRVIRAAANLGLARARNALLHAVGTTHAFQLDADNTAVPAGAAAVFDVARRYGAAFTYGTMLKVDQDGRGLAVMSNEPLSEPWLRSNSIDTMAVVDVAVLRRLRGWPEDPVLEHVDDWALVHRLATAGELIGFVPVVTGRYLALADPFHLSVPDRRLGPDRVARTFDPTGQLRASDVAAFAAHPDLGPLWATPAAIEQRSDLAPSAPAPSPPEPDRILVVAPGGVENLGDDAITVAVLDHLAAMPVSAHLRIDVITDGDRPVGLPATAEWLGTLHEAVWGLRPDELEDDDRVAAAAARVGAGRLAHRPVDPGRYRAAVFLGGGSLTSLWGDTLVAPRAVIGSALRRAGVPYAMTGQGLGPLDDVDRALVEQLAAGATGVTTRDLASARILDIEGHHLGAGRVGDDAMVLRPAPCARPVEGRYLVLSVRLADYVGTGPADVERWAAEVDAYAAERGLTVLGVPFNDQPGSPEVATLLDLARSSRAARWLVRDYDPDPRRVATVLGGADAVVTHSYHAALLALLAGVPAVLGAASPYYEGKADGLCALLDLPAEVVVHGTEPLDLARRVDWIASRLDHPAIAETCASVAEWWLHGMDRLLAEAASRSVSG